MLEESCDALPERVKVAVSRSAAGLDTWRFATLRPHRWSLDRHAAGAPHQIKLQFNIFGCTVDIGLGAYPDHAVAQPALQRAETLPFQPVERIAVRMTLRNRIAGKFLPQLSSWQ